MSPQHSSDNVNMMFCVSELLNRQTAFSVVVIEYAYFEGGDESFTTRKALVMLLPPLDHLMIRQNRSDRGAGAGRGRGRSASITR